MKKLLTIICLLGCFIITSCEKDLTYEDGSEIRNEFVSKAKSFLETNFPKTNNNDIGVNKLQVNWAKHAVVTNKEGNSVLTVPITNILNNEQGFAEFAFLMDGKGSGIGIIKKYVGDFSAKEIELTIFSIEGKSLRKGVFNTETGKFRRWYDLNKIKTGGSKLKASSDPQILEKIKKECPQGLMFNPPIAACDWPSEVTDDWASPYYWHIIYDDGNSEYLPFGNEIDEVDVYPPGTNPGDGTGGGGGFPVGPGSGSGSGGGSDSGGGSGGGTGGGGSGSGGGFGGNTGSGFTTETSKQNFDPSGSLSYFADDYYNDNGTSKPRPFDFMLEVVKTRSQSTGQVMTILSVVPIPKKPVDEYTNIYGELVVRTISVMPSTVSYVATPLANGYLISASFTINAVYKYYDGPICTKVITRQYQRTGSCIVW
ncbi:MULTISPECIES: chitin binding peritrophin-A domain-containing protein [unclassified Sphingobacterium]|uniref:chitin binding peritrophin-A domain-containing protein n=1 Tax=unclassified Sphingobacterium TaxID=2609468 RepID=UPI00104686CA|nr:MULTISPECIES: chitin binding peritrophin-A domain-containing protein [unclassified Sphingobacterium]MCS3556920.1 hypothetical protein [Sphingobacterium sp. JUb21]TCQ98925.1 hypothetical protein EDF66_11635 [Sphingobacterium sp. JUb20]